MIQPLFVGGMGPLEIGIILLLIVVLFGADKIPKLARSAGEAKKEFEKAKIEAEQEVQEFEQEVKNEGQTQEGQEQAQDQETASQTSTNN